MPNFKLGLKIGPSEVVPPGRLMLSDYLVDPLPAYNGNDDFTAGITNWGGALGNDTEGDCVECADTSINVVSAVLAGEVPASYPVWPSQEQVLDAYWAYGVAQGEPGPDPDEGTDPGSYLLWRLKNPIGNIKPLGGFVQVDISGPEFQSAHHLFGGLLYCVNISQEAMNQAESDPPQPWTSTATDWIGGHGIHGLFRNAQMGKVRTWGFIQEFSWEWWRAARTQAFALLTPEMMSAPGGVFKGVKVAQLAADITALHGSL